MHHLTARHSFAVQNRKFKLPNSVTDRNTNNLKKTSLISSVSTLQSGNTVNLAGRDTSYNVQQCYSMDTGVTATLHWLLKIKGASNYEFERPLRRLPFPASVRKKTWQKKLHEWVLTLSEQTGSEVPDQKNAVSANCLAHQCRRQVRSNHQGEIKIRDFFFFFYPDYPH